MCVCVRVCGGVLVSGCVGECVYVTFVCVGERETVCVCVYL